MLASASSLMCLATFFAGFGAGGSIMLGGRDEASDTGAISLKVVEPGGVGNIISAPLDAVRRRRCALSSRDELDLMLSDGALTTLLSKAGMSSMSLLVSLFATLTAMSASSSQGPGVIGDGKDGRSVVVGDTPLAVTVGDDGGENFRAESSNEGGRGRGCLPRLAGEW